MIVCFLIGLFAWFGVDVQKKTEGLSTTQKVASIGSASFTIMTIVALFVRAAMCTGEWQWILQMCGNVTGWSQLTSLQRQQPVVKDKLPVIATAPALPFQASSKADNALGSECIASAGNINVPSSPSSVDSSTFEEWKKK